MMVPREARAEVTARVVFDAPLEAPIVAGEKAGELIVSVPGQDDTSFDLVAGSDVARGGLMTRIGAAAYLTRDRALGMLSVGQ